MRAEELLPLARRRRRPMPRRPQVPETPETPLMRARRLTEEWVAVREARDAAIAELVANGMSGRRIAAALGEDMNGLANVSEATVRRIAARYGLHSGRSSIRSRR